MRRFLALAIFIAACAPPPTTDADTDSTEQAVLGAGKFDGSCNNSQETLILDAERFGRRVVKSGAFQDCMRMALSSTGYRFTGTYGSTQIGPYIRSTNDPAFNGLNDILTMAWSPNNFMQGCTSTRPADGTIASTTLNYGLVHSNDEGFQWVGPIVSDEVTALSSSTMCPGSGLSVPQCRFPYPWPLDGMAGTAWHEASHTHGFQHDPNRAGFDMTVNSMPYIIQQCITVAAQDSARANAGGPLLANGCPRGQLSMAMAMGGTTTTCVDDPRLMRLPFSGGQQTTVAGAGIFSLDWSGNVYKWIGSTFSWIGFGGRQFAANDDALYAITSDGSQIVRYDGTGWTQIGTASQKLIVGGRKVFSIAPDGTVWRWNGTVNNWTQIGGAGAQFVAGSDGTLWALNVDRSAVLRYTDATGWVVVGGPAAQLFVAGTTLHAVRPDRLAILRYVAGAWTVVVSSSTALQGVFSGGSAGQVYGLYASKLTQYRGLNGRTLETLAEDANNLVSYNGRLFIDRNSLGVYELRAP